MHLFNISVRKERYLSKINKLAYLTARSYCKILTALYFTKSKKKTLKLRKLDVEK